MEEMRAFGFAFQGYFRSKFKHLPIYLFTCFLWDIPNIDLKNTKMHKISIYNREWGLLINCTLLNLFYWSIIDLQCCISFLTEYFD